MNILFSNHPKPDGLLYHYTSQDGLLGIIQKRKIWATNVLFLNDFQEVKYAIDLVEKNIDRCGEGKRLDEEEKKFLKKAREKLVKFETPDYQKYGGIYTCSFSEKGNLLSQWRGYCPNGNGFSIGFDFESSLGDIVKEQDFTLVKCEYDENKQTEMIDDFLTKILGYFHESENDDQANFKVWDDFLALAPILKHPKFEEEGEWRLVSRPKSLELNPVKFRTGKSMLIPYIEIKLREFNDDTDNKLPLNFIPEIYFGPTLYPHISRIALEGLLLKENVHTEDLNGKAFRSKAIDSKIPYRVYSP